MKLIAAAAAALVFVVAAPGPATAGECGLPDTSPMWVDVVDVPFWQVFAKPGVVVSTLDPISPPKFRARGIPTMRFDLYLYKRVGTPSKPLDPDTVIANANRYFDFAVAQTACTTPMIMENELFGAKLPTPWSETNQQYRENVLLFLRTLAQRGAHPALLINHKPFVDSPEAAAWWRSVAEVSDIIHESFEPANVVAAQGPLRGNRLLRQSYRAGVSPLIDIGVPPSRLGVIVSFSTVRGYGGRNGLKSDRAWYRVTKWYVLSLKAVAAELHLGSIWSWGWRWWRPAEQDPDKAKAACVWLWARDPHLCNGPRAAGKKFNRSVTEGQIRLPANVQCRIGRASLTDSAVYQLERRTADRSLALSALLARVVTRREVHVSGRAVLGAEAAVVAQRFDGSRSAYLRALAQEHVTIQLARQILADELRKARIELRLRSRSVSGTDVRDFYDTYGELLARPVGVKPAPLWLNGHKRGLALSSVAPSGVFSARTGSTTTVRGLDGVYRVTPLGPASPLAALSFSRAAGGIGAALAAATRRDSFASWLSSREEKALDEAVCRRDELPPIGSGELTALAPFLELSP